MDRRVNSIMYQIQPNSADQFHDGSSGQKGRKDGRNQETQRKDKKIRKSRKQKGKRRREEVDLIVLSSDSSPQKQNQEEHMFMAQIDEEEIMYYKEKLGLIPQNPLKQQEEGSGAQSLQKETVKPYIPPPIQKIAPKPIHQYPPYVLGPNDTWPPKYPHSMREFKKEMREQRRLK